MRRYESSASHGKILAAFNSRGALMAYLYETLSPERFQHLCQALLTIAFPNVQSLPIGQPDGGRDAVLWTSTPSHRARTFQVFQVKFARNPNDRDDIDEFVEAVLKNEKAKVERLKSRGATTYYLITNVAGTAHLDHGSIDRVQSNLTSGLGLPSYCWWRDDLDRRIDINSSVKWSYPEILRGSDLLQALLEGLITEDGRRRDAAIRAYLAAQYAEDQEVKFKQVDLYNNLFDLFVDVPVKSLTPTRAEWQRHRSKSSFLPVDPSGPDGEVMETGAYWHRSSRPDVGATEAMLGLAGVSWQRIVLEGAPGQGKSTITQYICQVHRARLMDKTLDVERLPERHQVSNLRLPFRIDLRDFATWTGGKNPFSGDPNAALPQDYQPSLESFIAHQVTQFSGGHKFTVSDLSAIAKRSNVLIVLDGLDEVADISNRERVVKEISKGSSRLETASNSLQVVVTSRPAAFANSPGFSEHDWPHWALQSMNHPQIQEYAEKWMRARQLSLKDKSEFRTVLQEKLNQPHMRDLARNPMQLAILLNLIQTRGLSLPDKRTNLYDSYMELFFSREAEKSAIVREHRDLLVEVHRYLAWILQTEAEEKKSRGSVTEDRLKLLIREYLENEGHPTQLVGDLFTGMVERVVALVSRVQGTFEFEVQPLREYFVARHLYETAPYSPPGSEQRGTKPERFDALARNFYWLNATRFYSGCFSRGELTSLAEGIEELASSEEFRIHNLSQTTSYNAAV